MPKIDFYILQDSAPDARLRFACRLAEKATEQEHKVFMCVPAEELKRLDDLLWTYSDRSFLPHEIEGAGTPSHPRIAVVIGTGAAPPSHAGLVINLSNAPPVALDASERIAEIVDGDAERKTLARERFKLYRDRGLAIETHNV